MSLHQMDSFTTAKVELHHSTIVEGTAIPHCDSAILRHPHGLPSACRQRKDASALSASHATSSATSAVWHELRQMQSAQPADDRHFTGLRQSVGKVPELP